MAEINKERQILIAASRYDELLLAEAKNKELREACELLHGFCCDGVVSWSLVTKERMNEVAQKTFNALGYKLPDSDEPF